MQLTRHRSRKGGFTLVELLIVIIIIGILAAIAIPMYLNQRDKAKNAGVKGGTHTIEVGIAAYAVDHADQYPAEDLVAEGQLVDDSGLAYIDDWPKNLFKGGPMSNVEEPNPGDYTYVLGGDPLGSDFTLVGHLSDDGAFVVR